MILWHLSEIYLFRQFVHKSYTTFNKYDSVLFVIDGISLVLA